MATNGTYVGYYRVGLLYLQEQTFLAVIPFVWFYPKRPLHLS